MTHPALSADNPFMPSVPNQPVSLKSLSVDSKGKLAHRRAVGPLGFSFTVEERTFECRFYERIGLAGLTLRCTLGSMPQGNASRRQRIAIRRISQHARTEGLFIIIRRSGIIDLEYKLRPMAPITGTSLLSHLTLAVLTLTPWCDLLEQHMASRP